MPLVLVSAGVLIEGGRVLVTQRKAGSHLAGLWEFPGGKVAPGESPQAALIRELNEEIGVRVRVGRPLDVTHHAYADREVLLLFFSVEREAGSPAPRALDVADLAWVGPEGLAELSFPPADEGVLDAVRALLRGAGG
ncbi:MAG TPA: (deoxy)nucleoside triphosphate pyrophosphohydrolase [Polyangiaceae bacterium]|nr:(deoxy)nucleoside triphosphate pyrophosphohydrolase [Polyangiaceae bacterium]